MVRAVTWPELKMHLGGSQIADLRDAQSRHVLGADYGDLDGAEQGNCRCADFDDVLGCKYGIWVVNRPST